jgi:hypothetical protein
MNISKNIIIILISMTIMLLILVFICTYFAIHFKTQVTLFWMILSAIVLLLNIIVAWYSICKLSMNITHQKDLEVDRQKFENIIEMTKQKEEYEKNILKLHHDINNHLGAIHEMLESREIDKTKSYIQKLKKELPRQKQ